MFSNLKINILASQSYFIQQNDLYVKRRKTQGPKTHY